jgi:predicted acetyltransferase
MSAREANSLDIDFIVAAYASAFAFERSRTLEYIENTSLSNFHVIEQPTGPAAVFALIETGHWFGGRPVPACNIAHVAIMPEHRGSGLAATILDFACAEALNRGAAIASLFASTRPVYRKSGFELAGSEMIYEADTSELYKTKEQFHCRRVMGDDVLSAVGPIYAEHCQKQNGVLGRGPAHWNTLLQAVGDEISTYVFEADGKDLSYIVLDASNEECLVLRDWVARSGLAARQILKFLGTFSTVYPRVRWHGAPQDPLVFAMPDKGWRLVHQEEFLMRILSPRDALVARGYECDSGSLKIEIDGATEKQSILLAVENGRASCEVGFSGRPDVTVGLAQFATLFSGFRSAHFLEKAGWIAGDFAAIKRCNDIFTGPAPWVGEHF